MSRRPRSRCPRTIRPPRESWGGAKSRTGSASQSREPSTSGWELPPFRLRCFGRRRQEHRRLKLRLCLGCLAGCTSSSNSTPPTGPASSSSRALGSSGGSERLAGPSCSSRQTPPRSPGPALIRSQSPCATSCGTRSSRSRWCGRSSGSAPGSAASPTTSPLLRSGMLASLASGIGSRGSAPERSRSGSRVGKRSRLPWCCSWRRGRRLPAGLAPGSGTAPLSIRDGPPPKRSSFALASASARKPLRRESSALFSGSPRRERPRWRPSCKRARASAPAALT